MMIEERSPAEDVALEEAMDQKPVRAFNPEPKGLIIAYNQPTLNMQPEQRLSPKPRISDYNQTAKNSQEEQKHNEQQLS